jgi:hypothetical protein
MSHVAAATMLTLIALGASSCTHLHPYDAATKAQTTETGTQLARHFARDLRIGQETRRRTVAEDLRLLKRVRLVANARLSRSYAQGEDYAERSMTAPFQYEEYVNQHHRSDYELVFSRHWSLTREYRIPRTVPSRRILTRIASSFPGWKTTFDNHEQAPPAPNTEVFLWLDGHCVSAIVYPPTAAFFAHHRTLVVTADHEGRSSCS